MLLLRLKWHFRVVIDSLRDEVSASERVNIGRTQGGNRICGFHTQISASVGDNGF